MIISQEYAKTKQRQELFIQASRHIASYYWSQYLPQRLHCILEKLQNIPDFFSDRDEYFFSTVSKRWWEGLDIFIPHYSIFLLVSRPNPIHPCLSVIAYLFTFGKRCHCRHSFFSPPKQKGSS